MKLYFVRHGLAGHSSQWQGDDANRPLTKKGKKRMEEEAVTLDKLGLKSDLILTSPLLRACQTAEIVAGQLKKAKVVEDERLAPGFNIDKLGEILREHSQAKALMLVGHEPDFGQTITSLIGGGEILPKKGSLVYVDVPDPAVLKGELVWLIPPKLLAP